MLFVRSFVGKFKDTVVSLSMGQGRSRQQQHSNSIDGPTLLDHELDLVAQPRLTLEYLDNKSSNSPPTSPGIERVDTPDGDGVLFSKNNVYLRYPKPKTHVTSKFSTHERTSHSPSPDPMSSHTGAMSSNSGLGGSLGFDDNQIFIPGYLFIRTRGSNCGPTLILNWAPNSSLHVPSPSTTSYSPPPSSPRTPPLDSVVSPSNPFNNERRNDGTSPRTVVANGTATTVQTQQIAVDPLTTQDLQDKNSGTTRTHKLLTNETDHYAKNTCYKQQNSMLLEYKSPSCSSVSIDLGKMEMIRVFYRTDDTGFISSGEMVVKSKDGKFKVFHFKHEGINDLLSVFRSWKYFKHQFHKEIHQHTFTVFQPKLCLDELHPLEGKIPSMLTEEMLKELKDVHGKITDKDYLLKVIFFKGMVESLRKEVWPLLLNVYSFESSDRERERIRSKRRKEYEGINEFRCKLEREAGITKTIGEASNSSTNATDSSSIKSGGVQTQEGKAMRETTRCLQAAPPPSVDIKALTGQVEKDVIRTDRSNVYYKGEDNVHIRTLKHILLNYLISNPDIGYSQGMTDLLAPLLAALDDEMEAYWCFRELVQSSIFLKPGKSHISVSHQLEPLRLLIKLLIPSFYSYLENTEDGLTLMFCHRWLLVCLKREFPDEDALAIWETCWTAYETNSFHLFVCIAIMAMYGQRAMDRHMNINELMVFFNNTVSQSIPCDVVMSQARGYLHRFCQSSVVDCQLYHIMNREFWEKDGAPNLACDDCKGLVGCPRTSFLTKKGAVC